MKLGNTLKPRLRASSIHFSISAVVFVITLYLIVFHWYPGALFSTDGGWVGVKILIGVDLVLGPLLTLIIFNPNKAKRLIFIDFSIITAIQISAFSWGLYAIYNQQPLAITFHNGNFYSIKYDALKPQKNAKPSDLTLLSRQSPPVLFTKRPETENETKTVLDFDFLSGIPASQVVFLQQPIEEHLEEIQKHALDIRRLSKAEPTLGSQLERFLKDNNGNIDDYIYINFSGNYGEAILILNQQGKMINYLSR